MELDKRILPGKRPLTCFDTEEAKQFIGKECYLSNSFSDYADLNNVTAKRILDDVSNTSIPYSSNPAGIYCYCLPCLWVKQPEKKYREYKDLDEFFDVTGLEIGDLIKLKFPGNNVAELLIVGGCDNGLFIGIHKYTFKQLFELVEISISGEWQPFGVEDASE
jgi:hypothetical protein